VKSALGGSPGPSWALEVGSTKTPLTQNKSNTEIKKVVHKHETINDVSKDSKLKVLVLNARSIIKIEKRLEVETYVKLHGYKIIAVTESWATPEISDCELGLEGFVLFRKDRSDVRDGKSSGVLLYVSNEVRCVQVDKLNAFKFESIWVKLQEDLQANVIVGVCYKSPSVSEQELKNLFSAIKQAGSGRCLVVGDFNYPSINWDNWECNKEHEEFVDLIQDNFFLF